MGLLITGLIPSIHHQVNVALGDVVYLMNGQKTFTQCCVTVFRGFEIGLTSFVFFLEQTPESFRSDKLFTSVKAVLVGLVACG